MVRAPSKEHWEKPFERLLNLQIQFLIICHSSALEPVIHHPHRSLDIYNLERVSVLGTPGGSLSTIRKTEQEEILYSPNSECRALPGLFTWLQNTSNQIPTLPDKRLEKTSLQATFMLAPQNFKIKQCIT